MKKRNLMVRLLTDGMYGAAFKAGQMRTATEHEHHPDLSIVRVWNPEAGRGMLFFTQSQIGQRAECKILYEITGSQPEITNGL